MRIWVVHNGNVIRWQRVTRSFLKAVPSGAVWECITHAKKNARGPRIFGATRPVLVIKLNTTINKITKFVVFSNSHFDLLEAYA